MVIHCPSWTQEKVALHLQHATLSPSLPLASALRPAHIIISYNFHLKWKSFTISTLFQQHNLDFWMLFFFHLQINETKLTGLRSLKPHIIYLGALYMLTSGLLFFQSKYFGISLLKPRQWNKWVLSCVVNWVWLIESSEWAKYGHLYSRPVCIRWDIPAI